MSSYEKVKESFLEELKEQKNDFFKCEPDDDSIDKTLKEILLTEDVLGDLSDEDCEVIYSFIKPVQLKKSFITKVMKAIQDSEEIADKINRPIHLKANSYPAFAFRKDEKKATEEDDNAARKAIEKFLDDLEKEGE